jgi:hypothetical protein
VSEEDVVERVDSAVYTVPTDAPEADGTLAWDGTTLVLATVRCGGLTGLGYAYAPAASAHIIDDASSWTAFWTPAVAASPRAAMDHRAWD